MELINSIIDLILKIIVLGIGFAGGVITAYSQGWFKDYFSKKESDRNRAQRIIDSIGEITTKIFNEFSNKERIGQPHDLEGYFERCAGQLEALKQQKVANDIREFHEIWFYLSEFMDQSGTEVYKAKELLIRELAKRINSARIK